MCLFRDVPPQRREMLNSVVCLAWPLTDVSLKSCCSRAGVCLEVTSRLLSESAVLSDLHTLAACKITKSLARSYASTGPFRLDVVAASLAISSLAYLGLSQLWKSCALFAYNL